MMTATAPFPTADPRAEAESLFRQLALLEPGTPERRQLRDRLVESHMHLVGYFARRYAGRGEPYDDLLQAGALGLVKAVDRFDPGREVAFSTYAGPTILGEIRRHFRDRTWSVHVHRSLQERTIQVDGVIRQLEQDLLRSPTVAEICKRTGLTDEEVVESLQCYGAYRSESLDAPVGEDRTLGDLIGAETDSYGDVDMHESLTGVLAKLPERDRVILQLRFYGNMTQLQIARKLGISQMHVSRLLSRALARLREDLTD
jgi:RNA polymerase sigma-B factor